MFEENMKDFFFEWGVKAANDNFVGLADVGSPLQCQLRVVWRCFTRSEECHQSSVEQVLISDQSEIPVGIEKSYAKIVAKRNIKKGISATPRN